MTEDATPTLETVKADLEAKLAKAKSDIAPLAAAAKQAEKAVGDAAIAHAKNPNLPALLEVTGKHTEAAERLAVAEAGAARFSNKLAGLEADRQREADRAVVAGITTKGRAKCPDMHTIHAGLSVSGTIPVDDLNPTKEEKAVCERHGIDRVTVATVREEGKPPMIAVSFFGKVKRARSGGGGGGKAKTYTDGTITGTSQVMAEAHKPESAAKIAAAIAEGKSASYAHIAAGLVEAGTISEV